MKVNLESYKGVRDFYPSDMAIQNYIFSVWKKVTQKYGYEEYSASLLEPSELYKSKSSQEIISGQTYTFLDRGGREVTLRPEMTPTVARMVAAKHKELGSPLRWFSIPNVFRYEQPQRGRTREHWQLNADIFGIKNEQAELELILMANAIMKAFGAIVSMYTIRIGSRSLMQQIFAELEIASEKTADLLAIIDRRSKMEKQKFEQEIALFTKEPQKLLSILNARNAQELHGMVGQSAPLSEMENLFKQLKDLGITNAELSLDIVRGFDYYTGIVFELFDNSPTNKRALCGGGRYDHLMDFFSNEPMCAAGFGMGDVTLKNFLEERELLPGRAIAAQLYICTLGNEALSFATNIAEQLRAQNIAVLVDYTSRKVGDQLHHADRIKVPFAVCIGEHEIKSGIFKMRNMTNREEKELNINELIAALMHE